MVRRLSLCLALLFLPGLLMEAGAEETPRVLLDFEQGEPTDGWKRQGLGLFDARAEEGNTPSGGRALGLEGQGGRGHIYRPVTVRDWRSYRALSFFAKVEAKQPIRMRFLAVEASSFRARLKRFTLEPGDWREVVLPLAHFRWDLSRPAGRFDQVGRILFQWDKGGGVGKVMLDDVRLLPGTRGVQSCLPTEEEHLALAFPNGDGRTFTSDNFLLMTDVPAIDAEAGLALLMRCEKGLALLRERFHVPGALAGRVPLALFAARDDYVAFFERVGDHFGAGITPPKTDGYSALRYAASSWDPKQGHERPVYVHEAMHAALERLLHVGSDGNWVQEALASAVQVSLHPKSLEVDLGARFRARDRGEPGFLPLSALVRTPRPGLRHYAQLHTFVEFLADEHAEELPAFWEGLMASWRLPHESGPRALEQALEAPLERIGTQWIAWGVARHGGNK